MYQGESALFIAPIGTKTQAHRGLSHLTLYIVNFVPCEFSVQYMYTFNRATNEMLIRAPYGLQLLGEELRRPIVVEPAIAFVFHICGLRPYARRDLGVTSNVV